MHIIVDINFKTNVYMKNSKLQLDPVVEEMLKQAVENDGKAMQEMVQEMVDHPERMPRFMDLKVDWAFKYVLGHKPVLMKLINDVLPVQVSEIEDLPNELPVTGPKEKRSSFDVLCKERGTGKQFLAEMQLLPTMDMDDRLMFYGSSLIHKQIERGSESYHLSPAYVLCIANYFRSHTKDTPLDKFKSFTGTFSRTGCSSLSLNYHGCRRFGTPSKQIWRDGVIFSEI